VTWNGAETFFQQKFWLTIHTHRVTLWQTHSLTDTRKTHIHFKHYRTDRQTNRQTDRQTCTCIESAAQHSSHVCVSLRLCDLPNHLWHTYTLFSTYRDSSCSMNGIDLLALVIKRLFPAKFVDMHISSLTETCIQSVTHIHSRTPLFTHTHTHIHIHIHHPHTQWHHHHAVSQCHTHHVRTISSMCMCV